MTQIRREKPVRYEHPYPGSLVHVDIKKLGNIPDGGGWRVHGREIGERNSQTHRDPNRPRKVPGRANLGYSYLHNAVDDHSRLAYVEILPDQKAPTAAAFWHRAVVWFAAQGIFIDRVLTDNGSCYRSKKWAEAMPKQWRTPTARTSAPALDGHRQTTNGKAERFNRTLLKEWAYARPYPSEQARRQALPKWLHTYNHHRAHTALGGHPPASRVTNLSGQYN